MNTVFRALAIIKGDVAEKLELWETQRYALPATRCPWRAAPREGAGSERQPSNWRFSVRPSPLDKGIDIFGREEMAYAESRYSAG